MHYIQGPRITGGLWSDGPCASNVAPATPAAEKTLATRYLFPHTAQIKPANVEDADDNDK